MKRILIFALLTILAGPMAGYAGTWTKTDDGNQVRMTWMPDSGGDASGIAHPFIVRFPEGTDTQQITRRCQRRFEAMQAAATASPAPVPSPTASVDPAGNLNHGSDH